MLRFHCLADGVNGVEGGTACSSIAGQPAGYAPRLTGRLRTFFVSRAWPAATNHCSSTSRALHAVQTALAFVPRPGMLRLPRLG